MQQSNLWIPNTSHLVIHMRPKEKHETFLHENKQAQRDPHAGNRPRENKQAQRDPSCGQISPILLGHEENADPADRITGWAGYIPDSFQALSGIGKTYNLDLVGVRQALPAVQRLGDTRGTQWQATVAAPLPQKINLISKWAHGPHIRY